MWLHNSYSFIFTKLVKLVNKFGIQKSNSKAKMFIANKQSFLLAKPKSFILKSISQSGIDKFATSLSPPPLKFSSKNKRFVTNKQSFLLAKPITTNDIKSTIDKQNTDTQEYQPSNGIKSVDQSEIKKPATSQLPTSSKSNSKNKIFVPNQHSFLLASPRSFILKPTNQYNTRKPTINLSLSTSSPNSKNSIIGDKNKRAFLKAAGIAGASIIGSLILPKKADALIMGSSPTTGVVGVKNSTNSRVNPATEETLNEVLKTTDLDFDGSGNLNVNVQSNSIINSFSDSGDIAKSALVDADRHVQVDVISSALPASATTETTLQTIAFGGSKFTIYLATDSGNNNLEYVGEASIGTATSSASWRIKRLDTTSGTIIKWAGTGNFDQIWDNRESLNYT